MSKIYVITSTVYLTLFITTACSQEINDNYTPENGLEWVCGEEARSTFWHGYIKSFISISNYSHDGYCLSGKDLNIDGSDEVFILDVHSSLCGSDGCSFNIYNVSNRDVKIILMDFHK